MKKTKLNYAQVIGLISSILLIVGVLSPWVEGREMGTLTLSGLQIDGGLINSLDGYIQIIFGILVALFFIFNTKILRTLALVIAICSITFSLHDAINFETLYPGAIFREGYDRIEILYGLYATLIASFGIFAGSIINLAIEERTK